MKYVLTSCVLHREVYLHKLENLLHFPHIIDCVCVVVVSVVYSDISA